MRNRSNGGNACGEVKEVVEERKAKRKIVSTLGPASRSVGMLERLLRAGMNMASFNFSHGSHEYHQETLDNLRTAMHNTAILCAVMLDTKGPEIRTGFLKDGKPIQIKQDSAIQHAEARGLCKSGDSVVALHRVGTAFIIKIITVK